VLTTVKFYVRKKLKPPKGLGKIDKSVSKKRGGGNKQTRYRHTFPGISDGVNHSGNFVKEKARERLTYLAGGKYQTVRKEKKECDRKFGTTHVKGEPPGNMVGSLGT